MNYISISVKVEENKMLNQCIENNVEVSLEKKKKIMNKLLNFFN